MGQDGLDDNTKSNSLKKTQVLKQFQTLSDGTLLIGRFEIESKQGCGRYGCVYKARDLQLDTFVAIKVLHPHLINDDSLQSFKNEILTLRQLSHPNIVRVHEYYHDNNIHFITMDWIEGRNLADLVEQEDLSQDKVLYYARQILSALSITEQKGVSHCDLKPENILVDAKDHLYVADFGVASALGSETVDSINGTPVYASPEYLEFGKTNKTTDIYSFGVILFELLTGKTPFKALKLDDLLAEKKRGDFHKLPKKFRLFKAVTDACLAPEPGRRPNNLAALSELLRQTVDVNRKPSSKLYPVLAVLGLLLVLTGGTYLYFNPNVTNDDRSLASQQKGNQAVAVLPFRVEAMPDQLWLSQGLPTVLSQKLARSAQLRVVGTDRTQQTMDLLGYSSSLNEQKLLTLSELLQTPAMLDTVVTLVGPEKYRLQATIIEVVGNNLSRHSLVAFEANEAELSEELLQIAEQLNQYFELSTIVEQHSIPSELSLQRWTQIELLLHEQKFSRAMEQLQSVLEEFPDFAQGWFLKGKVAAESGSLADAEGAFNKVKSLTNPEQLLHQLSNAELQLIAGDLSAAAEIYSTVLDRLPRRDDIRFELAQLYIELEALEKAEAELNRIVAEDQNHPSAWYELSKVAIWRGETEKAVDDYLVKALVTAKKLKNEQLRGDVLNAFGVAYHRLGELDLSLDYYQQGLAARESIGDARGIVTSLSNLASIYAIKGEFEEAEQRLYRALEVNKPRNDAAKQADLYNELGIIAEEQGAYGQALEHFRASLSIRMKLDDDWLKAESLNNVAYIYFLLSDEEHATIYWEQAKNYYEKVQDPVGVIRVNENVAQLNLRKGDWQAAFQTFSLAKEESESLNLFEEKIVAEAYLAKIALLKGNFIEPLNELQEIKQLLEERKDVRGQLEFGLWLVEWQINSGNYSAAANSLNAVQPLLKQEHNQSQQVIYHVLNNRLRLYQNQDSAEEYQTLTDLEAKGLTSRAKIKQLLFEMERLVLLDSNNNKQIEQLIGAIKSYDLELHQFARLRLLQLQATYYIEQQNLEQLEVTIEQLAESQRMIGVHWSDFFTQRLVANYYRLLNKHELAEQYLEIATSKLEELLKQLPEEQRQYLISLQGRYSFTDDFMENFL
ncbi:serine/threonine-protein kinase [Kangiella shandongensis]|uniref:serine/threonine-protein kinase n=1 Tax=Kangiella shandongensis TaxID=2763258 RepID=UPI001CBE6F03|nr:serine/threonine-protein kinase [Kangiella shandongensis]